MWLSGKGYIKKRSKVHSSSLAEFVAEVNLNCHFYFSRLAQQEERTSDTREVTGSNPVARIVEIRFHVRRRPKCGIFLIFYIFDFSPKN